MKAVAFNEFGGPDVLRILDLPVPTPGPGEVLVQVNYAVVNPTDILMISGKQAGSMANLAPPYIAGMEFSGIVAASGSAGCGLVTGQTVMGIVNPRRPQGGAQAQYVCVPEASLAGISGSADLSFAACVPMNGLTALMALEFVGPEKGSTLLVTGGAGVVARYVIQMAKRSGVVVVADAREADVASLRELGVDIIVPRGEAMTACVRAHFPDGVDGLIDTALIGDTAAKLVRTGGAATALRSTTPITDPRLRSLSVSVQSWATNSAALRRLADMFEAGILTPKIAKIAPVLAAAEAYALTEIGGLRGRVVLKFDEPSGDNSPTSAVPE